MTRSTLTAVVLTAAATAWPGPLAAADEPAPKLGYEANPPPAGEAKVIQDLVALQVALMKKTDPTKRG